MKVSKSSVRLHDSLKNVTEVNVTEVAVAVIHYDERYLLGFRNAHQHQGERYEFIGGKIESDETALQAIHRELQEEIGMVLTPQDLIEEIGEVRHNYKDKKVLLKVFSVTLCEATFCIHHDQTKGCEGQRLIWVTKQSLLKGSYVLPDANVEILNMISI